MRRSSPIFLLTIIILLIISCACMPNKTYKLDDRRVSPGVTVEGLDAGGISKEELNILMQEVAAKKNQPARNAYFDGAGVIMSEQAGKTLDINQTVANVLEAKPHAKVSAIFSVIKPIITENELRKARVMGSFVTDILDDSPGRLHNLRLTASFINNTDLEVGQEFSFNRAAGEPTKEKGFQEAIIFGEDGQAVLEVGGGMCQVSSTLYNAVLAADLKVTERHPHSRAVNYVPPGRDATIYTDKDFRFVNTSRKQLVIRVIEKNKKLSVDLLSIDK
ncbi:VanW family protein [Dendrosporobacter sp. 1207_IL3150]|uniref:VanW family protein n=1 Tax=Dendrosporobacter sp. 1207_IL3150 TaxID=3084054 RepID=UPI002FDAE1A9